MATDRTVPSERNNTYTPSEVSRRTAEELFEIAFNEDQKKVLLPLLSGDEDTPAIPAPAASDNGKVLGVDGGEYKLVDGANVEVVELGTVNGGGASYARTDNVQSELYTFAGSGTFADSKTLSEVLGGKKIVALAFEFKTDVNCFVMGSFVGIPPTVSGASMLDIRTAQNSQDYDSATRFNIFATVYAGVSSQGGPNGKPLTVYAICI